ncbi:LysR family transcriptional regulator substrate-binding protein [Neobacillus pocheonensis]|uniref:LysR family transcriptional regulator substrate-binding protein n=1 Tax=Neobacillus pocheonensis TaxID=363869 RepID=A0ABT0WFD9_9BACI|nr:LysR family transcriptional regulator substrate-binding protein [Neobacillus pocheonensis]
MDIGLISLPSSSHKGSQQFNTTHILDSSVMICFRKDSPLANKESLTIEDIYQYPIAIAFNNNDQKMFYSQLLGKFSKLNTLVQSQNSETRKYFISEGLAICFEPELTTKSDPFYQREDIIVKPVLGIESKVTYSCIQLKNQNFSVAAQEFLKELIINANNFK